VRALRRLAKLRSEERILLAWSVVWLLAARCALVALPLVRARRLLESLARRARVPSSTPAEIRWAVLAAARRLPRTGCLPRALALQALLRQAGIPSDLRIGVSKEDHAGFTAHAWVEYEGRPIVEDEDLSPYRPLSTLPE
jgi:Transglutaminase-like superfamily